MQTTTFNPVEMSNQFSDVANLLIPAAAGAIGWLAGRRKQKNDFLAELQSSVNMLSEKNKQQMEELIQLREENLMIRSELAKLREENRALRSEIETLNKNLVNVRGNVIAGGAKRRPAILQSDVRK